MELKPEKQTRLDILEDEEIKVGLSSKVVLYNDNWHTFDEVIIQLVKAVACSYEKARGYAFEVHVKGKCIVYSGDMKDCLKVSSVLEEIALNTQIIT
ncbi:MAG TPA: ATP-dependent Clp protease adaptor ClpS [Ignavibacteriaceae bacterium]